MCRRSFFSLVMLCCFSSAVAQQSKDSLRTVISGSANNKEKIKACISLAGAVLIKDFDECLSVSETGASLARSEKDLLSLSEFQTNIGISYYF
ncbi:MAG TPA: hypothetical protein VKH37_07935, partial [Ferruginibacter sp.]|nr:hypothetical protein [Ferruginibacter sp.]